MHAGHLMVPGASKITLPLRAGYKKVKKKKLLVEGELVQRQIVHLLFFI